MKKLWGGRFKKEMHPLLKCFSYSLRVDQELLEAEIRVNEAWVKMLSRIDILNKGETTKLLSGLKGIAKKFVPKGPHDQLPAKFFFQYEDVHTMLQALLEKKVGTLARKIHTGRSRNDLVVTSTKLYLRDRLENIRLGVLGLQEALVGCAKKAGEEIVAGMTHLKKAQPLLIAHHLLAYVEMLEEDRQRLDDVRKRMDVLPLGSAALAGSAVAVDQKYLAKALGFSKIATNSLQAVSDRGFLAEFLSALSILWVHLSRLSEDFILWNSEMLHWIELDDAFATGSSLMPQKKNPDVFELVRGRSSVMIGHLMAILTLQKGLTLGYHRDLQEDKPGLFSAIKRTELALRLLSLTVGSVSFKKRAMAATLQDDNLYATDLLDYLVRKGVSFRDAHGVSGRAVRYAMELDKPLRKLSMKEWKRLSASIEADVYDLFDPKHSVRLKKTIGSTHPARVRKEIARWERSFKSLV
ncbi:MAG: argininosuccinate lyase [Candidatus Omnitrophica bacterium]|nr:argininosuccinate lyase [Candidatus Omnitrophota bacterium]